MLKVKLYVYDYTQPECKGTDLSEYVNIASNITKKLDGTLSTYAITLTGYYKREEIPPSTKLIYELYEDEDYSGVDLLKETIDMIVQDDIVEQVNMNDNAYFIHHLTCADPAILAQQRVCDNMAVTYKLKDVNLTSTELVDTTHTLEETGDFTLQQVNNTFDDLKTPFLSSLPFTKFGETTVSGTGGGYTNILESYNFVWLQPSLSISGGVIESTYSTNIDLKNLFKNYVTPTSFVENITIPMLMCYIGEHGTTNYKQVGLLPVEFKITRVNMTSNAVEYYDSINDTWVSSEYWNLASPSQYIYSGGNTEQTFLTTGQQGFNQLYDVYYSGNNSYSNSIVIPKTKQISLITYKHTAVQVIDSSYASDIINPNTNYPYNRYLQFLFESGYSYSIDMRRKQYAEPIYTWWKSTSLSNGSLYNSSQKLDVDSFTTLSARNINIYATNQSEEILTKSSSIPNAYYLFKKAVLTTYFKEYDGTTMMLDTKTPIDVENDIRTLLEKTSIRENMYQQKNLWEIITEIGNYIHAKPYMYFNKDGVDDRLFVGFIKYGNMTQVLDKGTNNSIFNSRFVEEYISSLDAYVDNLMQLDSTITEYVVASSDTEDYLVYNDNCLLKTKYPIMEVVKLEALMRTNTTYSNSNWKDMTPYVFEYNVWKCLGIDTSVLPNRAISIYYHLGTNKIDGLQYLIPTVNNTQQYPFKKILATLFNVSETTIKINDFAFKITYRTKDSVRTRIVRPDIRKYLTNTIYDTMPIHTQFRNQTDKIVDSEKYGDNLYGEIIRTGNTIFEKNKWTYKYDELNKIGDLIVLEDDNLYYVSSVSSEIYRDHIESTIEYTKDFNRLAQIIGIPSEPRFYEISEQSQIRREININIPVALFIENDNSGASLDTKLPIVAETLLDYGKYESIVNDLMFGTDRNVMYNRAKINYKGIYKEYDTDTNSFDKTVYTDVMWSIQNTTITFEFDMEDNFMVDNIYEDYNDSVIPHTLYSFVDYIASGSLSNQAYVTKTPLRYTDVYGRADTCTITLGYNYANQDYGVETNNDIIDYIQKASDEADLFTETYYVDNTPNQRGIETKQMLLNKDNREALSFNINFSIITSSDRLIASNKIWQPKESNTTLKIVAFTDEELSKQKSTIDKINYNELTTFTNFSQGLAGDRYIDIDSALSGLTNDEIAEIKSIAICSDNGNGTYTYYIGRNVSGLSIAEKKKNWYMAVSNLNYKDNNSYFAIS